VSYRNPIHGLDSDAEPAGADAARSLAPRRPRIVCICGSMRFQAQMLDVSVDESIAGKIVVLPLVNMKKDPQRWGDAVFTAAMKAHLDRLHLAKIDLADEVLIVNPGGYIGDSTRREISYAEETGKPVRYLEEPSQGTPFEAGDSVSATPNASQSDEPCDGVHVGVVGDDRCIRCGDDGTEPDQGAETEDA
jgi:hypothetical protein